jgi:phosphoribosylglycinamide formyltransferase-1
MLNIAVFCSGKGTNLQAIIDAIKAKKLKGVRIAIVISDNQKAYALTRAKKSGIKSIVIEPKVFSSKSEFEKEVIKCLKAENVELVALAGFMRIVGTDLLIAYKNRIINIHPALLPSFKGAHGIKDAFDYGAKVTGVTIHFVDDKTDHGPIILQEPVTIKEDDTLESLEERIHKTEHELYYKAIGLFAQNRLKISGRNVEIIKK